MVFHVRAALVEAEFYAGLGIHLDRLDGPGPGSRSRFPPVRAASRGDDLIGRLLAYAGRIDEGLAILRGMYERASVESRSILPAILGWMAEAQIMAGRFAAAAELTREAIERAEETGPPGVRRGRSASTAVALAMLGRLDEADAPRPDGFSDGRGRPGRRPGRGARPARPRHHRDGPRPVRDAPPSCAASMQIKRAAGIREPRICAHASELIEALVGAGATRRGRRGAGPLRGARRETSRRAVVAGGGRPVPGPGPRRRQATLDGALAAAERSLSLLEGLPMPFERARTLFVLGQIRRRRKEKRLAREALTRRWRRSRNWTRRSGPDRARAELARIPLRQAATGLTPTEETIARLAAAGLTNREIADRTFLSPKTVEVNLTRIYRKLGVRSRAGLASRFASEDPQP